MKAPKSLIIQRLGGKIAPPGEETGGKRVEMAVIYFIHDLTLYCTLVST